MWPPCRYCSSKSPYKCPKQSPWEFGAISQRALKSTGLVRYLLIQRISPKNFCIQPPPIWPTHFHKICNPDLSTSRGHRTHHSLKQFAPNSDALPPLSSHTAHSFLGRGGIGEFDRFVSSPSSYHI